MLALDHSAYPHIFDLVIFHAPLETFLALRATSKALKRRVDAFFAHAALQPPEDLNERDKAMTERRMLFTTAEYPTITLPWLPSAVQALDRYSEAGGLERGDMAHYTQLHTLRRFDGAFLVENGPVPPGTTTVDFIDVNQYSWRPPIDAHLPHGTRKSVVHIAYDPSVEADLYTELNVFNSGSSWVHSRDFVFVLWPSYNPNEDAAASGGVDFLLYAILSALRFFDGQDISVIVAGMDDVHEEHRVASPEALCQEVIDLGSNCPPPEPFFVNKPEVAVALHRATRFLTREEWWDELGDQKDIVGVW